MKRVAGLFVLVFLIASASAVEFEISSEYPQGGAIISTISGAFNEQLTKDNFAFYRNHVRVPMEYDLKKIQDQYFLFVNLKNKEPGNYSIVIENAKFLKITENVEEDIERNFTISSAVADFSINKGFAITQKIFSINVQNIQDHKITVNYNLNETGSRTLYSGETAELEFNVNSKVSELIYLDISSNSTSYKIPIYVLGTSENKQTLDFGFEFSSLNITLDLNSELNRTIYLANNGSEEIYTIKLSLDSELEKYLKLAKTEIFNLSSGFLYPVEFSVFSDELPRKINGKINAVSGPIQKSIAVNLTFTPGFVDVSQPKIKSCEEIGGKICSDCSGEIVSSSDGNCCLSTCESGSETPAGTSSKKTWGWLILVLIVLAAGWIYFKKYKNAQSAPQGVFKFLNKEKAE